MTGQNIGKVGFMLFQNLFNIHAKKLYHHKELAFYVTFKGKMIFSLLLNRYEEVPNVQQSIYGIYLSSFV